MKQQTYFSKWHGHGNDFMLIDAITQRIDQRLIEQKAPILCHRHRGIGADGIILVLPSSLCDVAMKIYNADGSIPEMCGNGLRCFSHFVYDKHLIEKEVFSVETAAGKRVPALVLDKGHVIASEIDMGEPQYDPAIMDTPAPVTPFTVSLKDKIFTGYIVSMGNPHVVFFDPDSESDWLDELGPLLQQHPRFPNGVNVEVVHVITSTVGRVAVWERGVGKTLACGTGACAAAVAGIHTGVFERKVSMGLPGGTLIIEWQATDNHVIMTGPATHVYDGSILI